MIYYLYTDGSCLGNGKSSNVGGWSFLIKANNNIIKYSGAANNTTNNIMELTAVIKGLNFLFSFQNNLDKVIVYTDSNYIYQCYTDGWYKNWIKNNWKNSSKKEVKNKELWKQLIPYFEKSNIIIKKVKGHSDDEYNNSVDLAAKTAAFKLKELREEC